MPHVTINLNTLLQAQGAIQDSLTSSHPRYGVQGVAGTSAMVIIAAIPHSGMGTDCWTMNSEYPRQELR